MTESPDQGRSFAERILAEIRAMNEEIRTLRQFASILGLAPEGKQESYMEATMRLFGLLVAGTEETHRRLESLQATLLDPRLTAALRSAILDA